MRRKQNIFLILIVLIFYVETYSQNYAIQELNNNEEFDDGCGQTTTNYQSTRYYLNTIIDSQNIPTGYSIRVTSAATVDGNVCDIDDTDNLSVSINNIFCQTFTEYYNGCCEFGDVTFRIIPSGLNLTQPTNNNSDVLNLQATSGFHPNIYQWEFEDPRVTGSDKWRPLPAQFQSISSPSITAEDLFGSSADNYTGQTIRFRIKLCNGWTNGQIVTFVFAPRSPKIQNLTTNNTRCADGLSGGGFRLEFDRTINSGDVLNFELYEVLGNNNNGPQVLPAVTGQSSDIYLSNGRYYYNWPDSLPAGRYRVQYQLNSNGSFEVSNIFTIGTPAVVTYSVSKNDISCVSGQGTSNDGRIIINASGGSGSYRYSFDGVNYTNFSGSSVSLSRGQGNHTVYVRDTNNCQGTSSGNTSVTVNITQPSAISISGITQDATFGPGNNGSINISISGGNSGGYTYSWTGPSFTSSSQNIFGLAPGSYTVTVNDSKSCSTSRSFTVGRYEFASVNVSNLSCGNNTTSDDDGSISARVQGGVVNYRYDLLKRNASNVYVSTGNLETVPAGQTYTVNNLSEGFYRVSVTDDGGSGRTITANRTITAPAVFDFTAVGSPVSCNGGNDGSINLTINGGTPDNEGNYTITWSGPNGFTSTNEDLNGLSGGTYTLTLTDSLGCLPVSTSTTVIIGEPPTAVEITIPNGGVQNPTANGTADGSITINVTGGSGGYSYEWTKIGDASFSRDTQNISGLSDGVYSIIATDSAGCSDAINNIEIREPDPLLVSISLETEILCFQATGAVRATATGGVPNPTTGYTYEWFKRDASNNYLPINQSDEVESGLSEGFYRVDVTDNNGISASSTSFELKGKPEIIIDAVAIERVNCFGGSDGTITISASGGTGTLSYSIDNGANYQTSNNNEFTFTDLAADTYQIIVKDANECTSSVITESIPGPDTPIEITGTETDVTIFGQNTGAVDITVSGGNGGYSYSWSGPNGFTATTQDISNLVAGTYVVTVWDTGFGSTTDNAGCTLTRSFTITERDLLQVSIDYETPSTDLKCNGDDSARLLATVSGGDPPYSYNWFKETFVGSGIFDPLSDTTALLIGVDEGNYRVEISDPNGAMTFDEFYIGEPNPLEIIAVETDINCFGEATGAIDITITGGTAPYSYLWSNGATTQDINGLIEGSYSVTVNDSLGCTEIYSFTIEHNYEALQIDNLQVINVSSFEGNDGSISLNPTGGLSPYTINWIRVSDNMIISNNPNIENLTADDYHIIIEDSLGCTFTQTFTITQPDIVEAQITSPTCVGGCDGSISILVNEGNGIFTYLWDTGDTTSTIADLCAGEYSVIITGYDNRILERTYIVSDPDQVIINLGEDVILCKDQTVTLNATIDDPLASYLWQGDNGFNATTAEVTLSESASYTVFVTTALGCVSSDSIQITALDTEIGADFLVSSDLFIGEPFVIVDVSNPLPDLIQWNIPEGLTIIATDDGYAELVTDTPGDYQIQMTATLEDCTKTFTKTITVREPAFDRDDQKKDGLLVFIIYPNPNQGDFSINLEFASQTNIDMKLFSLASNALLQHINLYDNKTYDIPFNLQGTLPSGIYFLMLQTPNKSYVRKIIVE